MLLIVLLLFVSAAMALGKQTVSILRQLDDAVAHDSVFTAKRQAEIDYYKRNLHEAATLSERYVTNRHIAHAYSKFCSDSALVYFRRCQDMGQSANNRLWVEDAMIQQAIVLADRGDNYLSSMMLQQLGEIMEVSEELRPMYAIAMMTGYVRVAANPLHQFGGRRPLEAWEICRPYIREGSPAYYTFVTAVNPDYDAALISHEIRSHLARLHADSPDQPIYRMILALCFQRMGRHEEAIRQFALSALGDIRLANKNSSSITMLIAELSKDEDADPQRLLSYANLNSDNVNRFNDVGRSIHLVNAQRNVLSKYQQRIVQRQRTQYVLIGIVSVLLLMSLFMLRRLWLFNKTVTRQRHQLEQNMQHLEGDITSKSQDLSQKNEQISELSADKRKFDIVLGEQFALLSQVLNDVKSYKKEMATHISMGITTAAKKLAKESVTKDKTTAEFYGIFDRNFLFIHPDFPVRLNRLLKAGEQIPQGKDGALLPEQRIYALISLGMDDSKNIAEILHYSIQTVYNYRMKVRHAGLSTEKKVDDLVAAMYQ